MAVELSDIRRAVAGQEPQTEAARILAGILAEQQESKRQGRSLPEGAITLTEARALAKSAGMLRATDVVLCACLLGEIPGAERNGSGWLLDLGQFVTWLSRQELKPDTAANGWITSQEARTLALSAGIRGAGAEILEALLDGEIEGQRKGQGWLVDRASFGDWLEANKPTPAQPEHLPLMTQYQLVWFAVLVAVIIWIVIVFSSL